MKFRRSLSVFSLGFVLLSCPVARAFDLYSNGPFPPDTGQGYAFVGQSGDPETLAVSNSFVLSADSTIDTITVGIGVLGDYEPESFYWNIGSTAFGTDMGGTVFVFSAEKVGEDTYGNANFTVTFSLSGLPISAGSYWLTLSEGLSTNPSSGSDQLFWLPSTGGSSLAFQQENAGAPQSIASESFTIAGVPEPSTGLLLGLGAAAVLFRRRRAASV
jgi:hypothetical protein